jgi:hypothetical protein
VCAPQPPGWLSLTTEVLVSTTTVPASATLDPCATVVWSVPVGDGESLTRYGYALSIDAPEADGVDRNIGHTLVLTLSGVRQVMSVALRPVRYSRAVLGLMRLWLSAHGVDSADHVLSDVDVPWAVLSRYPGGTVGFLGHHTRAGFLHPADAR